MEKYIKYQDGSIQGITGYSSSDNIITICYDKKETPRIANDGFNICDQNGVVIVDGSDFIYRYDVLNAEKPTQPYTVSYTNDQDLKQANPYMTQKQMDADKESIPVEPLTNEELTKTVGELIYETSLMQIGLSGTEEVI